MAERKSTLKKSEDPVRSDLSSAITYLMDQRMHQDWYLREILPWERLIRAPSWRLAKSLLDIDAERVSSIVERLVVDGIASRADVQAWMCLGKVRQFRGDHEAAILVFRQMIERDDSIAAMYNVGLSQLALGNVAEARTEFHRVLSWKPGDDRTLKALATLTT